MNEYVVIVRDDEDAFIAVASFIATLQHRGYNCRLVESLPHQNTFIVNMESNVLDMFDVHNDVIAIRRKSVDYRT